MKDILSTIRDRFSDPKNFNVLWDTRAELAAKLVPEGSAVCDIGCGPHQTLKVFLRNCRYFPCDLQAWTADTEVCDLNDEHLPVQSLTRSNVVALLGVLEYIVEPERVWRVLGPQIDSVVFSYHPIETRIEHHDTWISKCTMLDIVGMVVGAGFRLTDLHEVEQRQVIFRVCRN